MYSDVAGIMIGKQMYNIVRRYVPQKETLQQKRHINC